MRQRIYVRKLHDGKNKSNLQCADSSQRDVRKDSFGGFPQKEISRVRRRRQTRGFYRAQQKRLRRVEMVPDGSLIVAMDLAQEHHCVWMMNMGKQPLDRLTINNTLEGMEKLIKRADEIARLNRLEPIIFAMEPTGHYWMSIASYLQRKQLPYVLVQPLSVKREREITYYHYAKSDFRDAELIGNLVADRKFTFTQLTTETVWANLHCAAVEYLLLHQKLIEEHQRIASLLERLYPEYSNIFKDPTGVTALSCLLMLNRATTESLSDFRAEIRTQSSQRMSWLKIERFYELLHTNCRDWGAAIFDVALQMPLMHAAGRYEVLLQQHREAQRDVLHWYEQIGYAVYANSMPNLEPVMHGLVLGFTGDPRQYDRSRCLTKFAGMDIKENESGKYHGQTPITHRGDPSLRYMTYLIGFVWKTHNDVARRRYQTLIGRTQRPLKKNQAIIAIGCKYLRLLWTLCTQHAFYDSEKAEHGIYTESYRRAS
jgi:transposase